MESFHFPVTENFLSNSSESVFYLNLNFFTINLIPNDGFCIPKLFAIFFLFHRLKIDLWIFPMNDQLF